MHLDKMEYFVKAIQSESLNKAASSLYITQPALSQAIKSFENELNITLLQRSPAGIAPTLYGQKVYRDCIQILEGVQRYYDDWQEDIRRFQNTSGTVTIGTAPMIGAHLASSFAMEVKKLCPHIRLSVLNILFRHRPEVFVQSFVDDPVANIGIGVFEEDDEQSYLELFQQIKAQHLQIRLLYKDTFKVLINRKNKLSKKAALTLDDLAKLKKISYHEDGDVPDDTFHANSSDLHAQTLDHMIQMLTQNLGVTVSGAKIAEKHFIVQSNMVKLMDLEDSPYPPLYTYLLYPAEDKLTDSEKVFIELLRYYLEDGTAEDFVESHRQYL